MSLCVSAGAELGRRALQVAAMLEVPFTFHVGMEQVSLPSASEADSSQQGLDPSEGSQASPSPTLASPREGSLNCA
jgi:hypothetical protein